MDPTTRIDDKIYFEYLKMFTMNLTNNFFHLSNKRNVIGVMFGNNYIFKVKFSEL